MVVASDEDWRECGLSERAVGEAALRRQTLSSSAANWQPRHVFLFSGHMIDAPERSLPRFPANKVPQAALKIAETLADYGAGPQDIALTQGACGGDLLFAEACRQRGVNMFWLQPFAEPAFLEASVVVGGDDWLQRYRSARRGLAAPPRAVTDALHAPAPGAQSAYERCNLWLLHTALAWGPEKLVLICLWNGAGAEGAGGTGHMVTVVEQHHGKVVWIDSRTL